MDETLEYARNLVVAKRNDMLQNARFNLTVQEQRVILYSVAQIKPEDSYLKEYEFDIKDFYKMIGWEKESYSEFKQMLKALSDKSWWITVKDKKGEEWESVVRWFTTVRANKKSGKVTVMFHHDMFPYLIELSKQFSEKGEYYTTYQLKYILAMQSKFSPRLYETLKSYQQNNVRWFFRVEDLQFLLCDCDKDGKPIVPETWRNFAEFKRRVLEPAVKEINEYTDLKIAYQAEKEGIKYTKIHFMMLNKTAGELRGTEKKIEVTLDGEQQTVKIKADDPFAELLTQHRQAVEEERKLKEGILSWIDTKEPK